MPHGLMALLFFLSQPFWEAKPPERWTDEEIDTVRHASPWVQTAGRDPEILVYLATAAPIEEAEGELRLRAKNPLAEPDPDYADFLRLNREKVLVLAIPWGQAARASAPRPSGSGWRMNPSCLPAAGRLATGGPFPSQQIRPGAAPGVSARGEASR